jgi:hypothetical protein
MAAALVEREGGEGRLGFRGEEGWCELGFPWAGGLDQVVLSFICSGALDSQMYGTDGPIRDDLW